MTWYLVRREYRYHAQEWVQASHPEIAKSTGATENEDVHHDDTWMDSEIIDRSDEDPGEEIRAQGIRTRRKK